MKLYRFDGMLIKIQSEWKTQTKILSRTPQTRFLKSHKGDIEKEIGAIREMSIWIQKEMNFTPSIIWDLMAGCGFSSRIFQKYIKPSQIIANDLNEDCVSILKDNFGNEMTKYNEDVFNLSFKDLPKPGFIFIDFNTFTIQNIDTWNRMFKSIFNNQEAPLAIVDSACYGFKFGNLVNYYKLQKTKDYYRLLDKTFRGKYNRKVQATFPFGPACIVLTVPVCGQSKKIYNCPSDPIKITIGTVSDLKGFELI